MRIAPASADDIEPDAGGAVESPPAVLPLLRSTYVFHTTLFLLAAGLIALIIGAELLVRGASRIASSWGISPLVVGLTVVAFGTSAPELAVSITSSVSGRADVAVGNVIGSNNFNILCILGLSALIVPLIVDQRLVRLDVPLMFGVSVVVFLMSLNGRISQIEGGALFAGLLAYTAWCLKEARRESVFTVEESQPATPTERGDLNSHPNRRIMLWKEAGFVIAGLALLLLGAGWFVDGATGLARQLNVSELVIGLTIIAAGTSLPELATSLVAALRNERDIAVGNVIGSNLFNLLGVLGLSAAISPAGVAVSDQAVSFDMPVMIAVSLACLPIFAIGHRISRWEGALFFGYEIVYVATLLTLDSQTGASPPFRMQMWSFVIPLTVLTLMVISWRKLQK